MIERTHAYKVGDQSFLTLEDAQRFEMKRLVQGLPDPEQLVQWMFDNKDQVLDILTTTTNSKPRARKVHGGTKNRPSNKTVISPTPVSPNKGTVITDANTDSNTEVKTVI
jgi:hypothetical protein